MTLPVHGASPLRIPRFRRLFAAVAIGNLGDGVAAVAIPWLATRLGPDPWLIGLVAAARQMPWLLFALPAGVVTDWFDHRRLLIGCDLARIGLALGMMALALLAGPGTAAALALAALAFVLGAAEVLRDNPAQSYVPALVPQDRLESANGLLWGTEQAAGQFIGPPLAGLLIGVALAAPFGFYAAVLALAVAVLARIAQPGTPPRPVPVPGSPWQALREGLGWLWRHAALRRLALTLAAFNFTGAMFWAVLVLYGQAVLHLDAAGYGWLLTLGACGGIAGSLLGPRLARIIGPTAGLLLCMASFVCVALTLALTASAWVSGALLALDAFATMTANIIVVSYRQRQIPAPLLGRVNAAYRLFGSGLAAFGALTAGAIVALAAPLGPALAVQLSYGVAALLAGVILLVALLRLRLG